MGVCWAMRSRTQSEILAALKRVGRKRLVNERAERIHTGLSSEQLRLPVVLQRAYPITVRAQVGVIAALVAQIDLIEAELVKRLRRHPDAEIYLSQPGMGEIVSSRVLGEFGDDRSRYAGAKARKNYAGTSPVTIESGRRRTVSARYVRNTRLIEALMRQAMCALRSSPGARAYYCYRQRARGVPHNTALRHVANRLVGILHGCFATRTTYDEATAWAHHLYRAA